MSEKIKDLVSKYNGTHPYLKILKKKLQEGEDLSVMQINMAERMLVTVAVKSNNKSLLPPKNLIDFSVDWDKYSNRKPYNHQKIATNWLLNKNKCILADDLGLGKSQSIVMAILEKNEKTIIICPKTLRLNWKVELSVFTSEKDISIIENKWVDNKIIIINYDRLGKYLNEIQKAKFKLVVSDESHHCRNSKSLRSKRFAKISNKCKTTWLITGTPMANRPMDFFNLLKLCKHPLGKNKSDFGVKYCDGKLTDYGWDYKGASNLKDLHYRTQDVMLRRLTSEVIDLPEKQRIPYYLEFTSTQQKAYEKYV